MCRSIKTLRPPYLDHVTEEDTQAAGLQYVRKISRSRKPSKAVREIARVSDRLLASLEAGVPA